MPKYPILTLDELVTAYCERQECEPEELKIRLEQQRNSYQPNGWILLECQVMDSSKLGTLTILPYGRNNTLKEVPEHPISPRGLASDTSVVIGVMPASSLQ